MHLATTFVLALLAVTGVSGHGPQTGVSVPNPTRLLLQANARWATGLTEFDPTYFKNLARRQDPKILWIGCSDSRVPESLITESYPGEMFVQRNVANLVSPGDTGSAAVVNHAVGHLKVEHVIVVGHTKCGAAKVSLKAAQSGADPTCTLKDEPASHPLNEWLTPLTRLAISLKPRLSLKSPDQALTFLVEENVKSQINNIANMEVMKEVWKEEVAGTGRKVRIHGWIFDLSTGRLRDLGVTRGPPRAKV